MQGRNPVVAVLDRAFGQAPDEEDAGGDNLWAWLNFRVARSGTNREGGFTEAQLSAFVEEREVRKSEDASKYLGYVASETLAKYGVDRLPRTVAPDPSERRAKQSNGAGEDDYSSEDERAFDRAEPFNPFRVVNDGLPERRNRE